MTVPSPPKPVQAAGEFDAVILADSPHADQVLLGLTLVERAKRIATRAGAKRVFVVDGTDTGLAVWDQQRGDRALLILRGGDQLVHMPLVKPLVEGTADRRVVVGIDGTYGGALWLTGDDARDAIGIILRRGSGVQPPMDDVDRVLHERFAPAAERIVHGDIARHPATTPAERQAAKKMLLRILVKPTEDSPVSQYIYRPLSKPMTLLLLHTPITPNQVTIFVGILGLFGCVLTALAGQTMLIVGALLVFIAGVIDGCDGEIARLKLQSSPIGAWLDTIVDEITSVAYFIAIGYHTYAQHPEPYIAWSIAVGAVLYVAGIYGIYYFCIVVLKAGGSQYYIGTLDVVEAGGRVGLRPRPRAPSTLSPWMLAIGQWLLYVIRRDFINLAALILTLFNLYHVIYIGILAGAVVSGLIVTREHIRLLGQLREVKRRGGVPQLLSS
ncbi:MAG: CDP-alcohol phosphatidyltransferase family protein [Myxococcota bacterium]|nr:CDP-alcohol phosphatidyltransferase family protein [Myxococcota bacterium]